MRRMETSEKPDAHVLLVIHSGGMGDFLLTFPALRALGRGRRVQVAGARERMALAVAFGVAEAALDLDALDFASVFGTPGDRLRAAVRAFDGILVWMRDDDGRIAAGLRAAGAPAVWCAAGLPPEGWDRHASEYFQDKVREWGLGGGEFPDAFQETGLLQGQHPAHDVMLHAGSGGKQKNWPIEHFLELSRLLQCEGRRVGWLRGPAEEALALPADAEALPPMTPAALAATLRSAQLYVGNDSGVSHLAGMAGCPTVAIFGPTNPAVWRPLGRRVAALRNGDGREWPRVAEVLVAAHSVLAV